MFLVWKGYWLHWWDKRHWVYMYSSWSVFSIKWKVKVKMTYSNSRPIDEGLYKYSKKHTVDLYKTFDISFPQNLYLIDTNCEQKCHIDRGVQYPIHQQKGYTTCKSICWRFHGKTRQTEVYSCNLSSALISRIVPFRIFRNFDTHI